MMGKLTFLGTGTSTGIPEIGCDCPTCTSQDPRDQRYRSSALIQYGGEDILIDCGPDVRSQLLSVRCHNLDRILLTHEHYDHTGGIDDMRPLFRDKPEVPLYAEANVIQAVMCRLPYAFVDHRYPGVPHIVMHEVSVGTPLVLKDGSRVEPIRVMHGKLPIVGYIFDKLAYITDCKTLPEETMEQLKGISTLMINALRLYEHPAHITLQEALHFIEKIKPQRAYLTHFAHTFGTHQEIEKMCPEGVFPAYDRLELTF
ncbi:MBL fold metallo-hydrolase [Porphyromonas somerae]|uniref:MBL fold metallo-hydrolase n=1 Tax=Porphyromonas somerae TaxID=322095 RepID=UPI002A760875|nr:MBL fold metallo-hydrolase [Porphyromonas somerae]MDY3119616.1 MBL fold metallo-hydrolase [Porphyromonas somerae]